MATDQIPSFPEPHERPPEVLGSEALVRLGDGIWVLPDRDRTPHVPNVGIIAGTRGTLVVETGMGIDNGHRIVDVVRDVSPDSRLYVTISHLHPEHGYGVQAFLGRATLIYNEAQRDELIEKGAFLTNLFKTFGDSVAQALRGIEYVAPDIVFPDHVTLDLGGRVAELHRYGPAHTLGDQIVWLPEERILFTGDLVEDRFFAIMSDDDVRASRWISQLERMEALEPAVVVPGHGIIAGVELITEAKQDLILMRDQVRERSRNGDSLAEMLETLVPGAHARHPDWGNAEWVPQIVEHFHREL